MTHFVGKPRSSISTSKTVVPSAPSAYAIIGGCGLIAVSPPIGTASLVDERNAVPSCSDSALLTLCGPKVSVNAVVVMRDTVRHSGMLVAAVFEERLGAGATCGYTV